MMTISGHIGIDKDMNSYDAFSFGCPVSVY